MRDKLLRKLLAYCVRQLYSTDKQRAADVSKSLGVSIGTYFQKPVGEKSALRLERETLDRFDRFSGMSGDGSTELIIATQSDIENIFNKLGW